MGSSEEVKIKTKVLRCPNCGASDATYDIDAGGLRCTKCRTVFASPKVNELGGLDELVGEVKEAGSTDLDDSVVITLRCPSCGANVMLDKDSKDIHCHWCRHNLSTAQKVPNGVMPDLILPFKIKRKTAYSKILDFVKHRHIFSTNSFLQHLSEENMVGIYLPYVVVDAKAKVKMNGIGETYQGTHYKYDENGNPYKVYEYNSFFLERSFDLGVDDLTMEASRDKLDQDSYINTNHIINAIMPFDTEEAVAWDPRFLKGFSCERRDVNVEELKPLLNMQLEDIARAQMTRTTGKYDRGVCWEKTKVDMVGTKWKTAYLPVWLYSYPGAKVNGRRVVYYIAVNARTGEVMGSIPLQSHVRAIMLGIPVIFTVFFIIFLFNKTIKLNGWSFISACLLVILTTALYYTMRDKSREYSNKHARHIYESETHIYVKNLHEKSDYCSCGTSLSSKIVGYNEDLRKGAHDAHMIDDGFEDAIGIDSGKIVQFLGYLFIALFVVVVLLMLFAIFIVPALSVS